MNIDLITKVVIPILGAILTYYLVPLFKNNTTEKQREDIYFWVTVAVKGAEMIYDEKGQGILKKAYVLNFLNNKGIIITEEELEVLIEAAVKELNIVMGK